MKTSEDDEQDQALAGHLKAESLWDKRCCCKLKTEEVELIMVACGSNSSRVCPSMHCHKKKDVKVFIHGDHFVVNAVVEMEERFREQLRDCSRSKSRWLETITCTRTWASGFSTASHDGQSRDLRQPLDVFSTCSHDEAGLGPS